MTMDISNQNKLSEFYEELKRLDIEIIRPDINECYGEFKTDDWKFEERLSKEFESVGFFISDHPLNQFKEIFKDYNIQDFLNFNVSKGFETARSSLFENAQSN